MLSEILSNKQIHTDEDSLQHWGKDWTNGFKVSPSAVVSVSYTHLTLPTNREV